MTTTTTIDLILSQAAALTEGERRALSADDPGTRYWAADAAFRALHQVDEDDDRRYAEFARVEQAAYAALRARHGAGAALPEWQALRHALLAEVAADLLLDPADFDLPADHTPDPGAAMLWTRAAQEILSRPWREATAASGARA